MDPHEIIMLRRDEAFIDEGCRVFDATANFFADREITQAAVSMAVAEIVPRFRGGRLPDMMIASFIGKQVNIERRRRQIAADWRQQEAEKGQAKWTTSKMTAASGAA